MTNDTERSTKSLRLGQPPYTPRPRPAALLAWAFSQYGEGNWGPALLTTLLAFGAHGAAWMGLGALPPIEEMLAAREVSVTLMPEPPPPEPPPPEPEVVEPEIPEPEPPEPPPEPLRREERRREEPETTPDPTPAPETPEEPPPLEERIEDFTGTTLTSETTAAGPSVIAGNGEAITGPVGAATGTTTGRSRRGAPDGAVGGSGGDPEASGVPLVAMADLSRRPSEPSGLQDALVRNYPRELRARGIEGEARVSFVLWPGGRLTGFRVVEESEAGFGEACRRTLMESSGWQDPLDRDGNPVRTRINFRCRFSVRL